MNSLVQKTFNKERVKTYLHDDPIDVLKGVVQR